MFRRPLFETILKRIGEPRRFIQVLAGPRQTGKTTLARQLIDEIDFPSHYGSADEPALRGIGWLEEQWELGRIRAGSPGRQGKGLLILDEVQKIPGWSETVKRLWDEDSAAGRQLRVIILGSSPLLLHHGLADSLAGRFETIPSTHWSYGEMRDAFGWNLERYVYYGGYPGAAGLIRDHERWRRYILDSLVETTVSRDILLMTRVDKPALLRRLFELGCHYSGRVLSYQKMLGQLDDAGNTTTLAHYLSLLDGAGMLTGLQKFAGQTVRRKASSPKLQVLNAALMTSASGLTMKEAMRERDYWGRLFESSVGAFLINGLKGKNVDVFYWSGRNREVDFVLSCGDVAVAIEVKSGRRTKSLPGMDEFCAQFDVKRRLLVGRGGIALEEFLLTPPDEWLR